MKCPTCEVTLTHLKSERGIIWSCPKCKGCAVGMGLLQNLSHPKLIRELWIQIEKDNRTGSKTCPDCHRKMFIVTGDERTDGIELDVCSNCMFFWFDPEEVGKFPRVSDEEVERRNTDALLRQTGNAVEMDKLQGIFDQTNIKSSRAERMAQETTAGAVTSILVGVAALYLNSDEE